MLASLKTPKGRIVIALLASIVLVALWATFDMPFAILPALVVPFWIPMFATQSEPLPSRFKLWLWVALGVGVLSLLVGVMVFFLANN
jgi:hypothetical protein